MKVVIRTIKTSECLVYLLFWIDILSCGISRDDKKTKKDIPWWHVLTIYLAFCFGYIIGMLPIKQRMYN